MLGNKIIWIILKYYHERKPEIWLSVVVCSQSIDLHCGSYIHTSRILHLWSRCLQATKNKKNVFYEKYMYQLLNLAMSDQILIVEYLFCVDNS